MDIGELFWLSFKELREKKVRTALTVIMVVIGVASIVALTSQTAGISSSIQTSLSSLGPTSIILSSTGTAGFTSADAALISSLPNVSTVIPIVTGSATLSANGQNSSVTVIGISQEGLSELLGGIKLYQGSAYNDTIAPDAIVGYSVAFPSSLSGRQNLAVGEPATLKISSGRSSQSITVPVVGILSSYGSSLIPVDSGVMLPVQSADIILHRTSFNTLLVKATNTSTVTALTSVITTVYGSKARIMTTQQLLETTTSIIGTISLLFEIIAGVSLLVAAIGIMNVMLISVYERTHEIGIMKSVGFRNRHVMVIFLFQAMIIGIIGGAAGIGMGAGASYAVAGVFTHQTSSTATTTSSSSAATSSPSFNSRSSSSFGGGDTVATSGGTGGGAGAGIGSTSLSYSPVFTPATIGAALLVAIVVSIIAGIYPAWRASKMEPIDALRML